MWREREKADIKQRFSSELKPMKLKPFKQKWSQHFNDFLSSTSKLLRKAITKLQQWHAVEFIKWLRKLQRVRRGLGRRTDQVVYSNEPCQQYSAYKQIGLTDDTVALRVSVSPANHLSTLVWTPGNVLLSGKLAASFSLLFSTSLYALTLHLLFLSKTQAHTGHHGKSLVIIFSPVTLPTRAPSIASSLLLLEKLWIMLVSHCQQGLHLGSANPSCCCLLLLLNVAFFSPVLSITI